ncbi:hypothetical protein AVEN_152868-1 [Araneus ventricosus]|uniref:Neurotransmitter-gated ion-channel ligand-binding domain-containing protein n=1 Tax=Araneus ventricosus TaxID=182803 RepID=A0A4Y2AEI1_ARAVE|nr:hypothetical protein AVEN_152868-1 [Araneus ventricosus]
MHTILASLSLTQYRDDRVNITKILNAFFDQGYDKRVRPNYGGPPVIVSVTMFILSISSVSEVLMVSTNNII